MEQEYNRSKVGDFFIGFGIAIGLSIVSSILSMLVTLSDIFSYGLIDIFNGVIGFLAFLAYVGLVVYFFKKNKKWIGIGMLGSIVISIILVLLLFGACFLMLGGIQM